MLATALDAEADWNEEDQIFKTFDKIIRTFNITQTAEGDNNGCGRQ